MSRAVVDQRLYMLRKVAHAPNRVAELAAERSISVRRATEILDGLRGEGLVKRRADGLWSTTAEGLAVSGIRKGRRKGPAPEPPTMSPDRPVLPDRERRRLVQRLEGVRVKRGELDQVNALIGHILAGQAGELEALPWLQRGVVS